MLKTHVQYVHSCAALLLGVCAAIYYHTDTCRRTLFFVISLATIVSTLCMRLRCDTHDRLVWQSDVVVSSSVAFLINTAVCLPFGVDQQVSASVCLTSAAMSNRFMLIPEPLAAPSIIAHIHKDDIWLRDSETLNFVDEMASLFSNLHDSSRMNIVAKSSFHNSSSILRNVLHAVWGYQPIIQRGDAHYNKDNNFTSIARILAQYPNHHLIIYPRGGGNASLMNTSSYFSRGADTISKASSRPLFGVVMFKASGGLIIARVSSLHQTQLPLKMQQTVQNLKRIFCTP